MYPGPDIGSLKPPSPGNLKSRQLPFLSETIDRFFINVKQRRHFLDGQCGLYIKCHEVPRLETSIWETWVIQSNIHKLAQLKNSPAYD